MTFSSMQNAGWWTIIVLPLVVTSCVMFPPPDRDDSATPALPDRYEAVPGSSSLPDAWWESFRDPDLNALVERSLQGNLSLQQVAARVRQVAAIAMQRNAALMPELSVEARASQSRQTGGDTSSGADTGTEASGTTTRETYSLGMASSYELDLWGRVRSLSAGIEADFLASRADLETAAMTLAAQVTSSYLELLFQRRQADILADQLTTSRKILELMKLRQRRSDASALDILRQKEAIHRIESQIPPVLAREQALLNELAVLIGATPGTHITAGARILPLPPPLPDTGVPADLLSKRPDIRATWLRLKGADWSAGAARADRLPAIRLTASASYSSSELSSIMDDWISNLAAGLVGPILDSGRRKAEVDRTRAVTEERLAAYRERVLNAVREVQDALTNEKKESEQIAAIEKQLTSAHEASTLALALYRKGAASYQAALSTLVNEHSAQLTLAKAHHDRLATRVRLYRALGGDWAEIIADLEQENKQ